MEITIIDIVRLLGTMLLLAGIGGDTLAVLIRRYKTEYGSHPALKKITIQRTIVRAGLILGLGISYFILFYPPPSLINSSFFIPLKIVWLGIYIGFVTNAMVTFMILRIFIPRMKNKIAATMREKIAEFMDASTHDTQAKAHIGGTLGGFLGIVVGLFIPGGLATTLLASLGGVLAGESTEKLIETKTKKYGPEKIEQKLQMMSHNEISDTMDTIIGDLFTIIEILGAVLGFICALLFYNI